MNVSCVAGAGNGGGVVGVVGAAGAGGAGASAGGTSEYVRNELRAVVGARSARPDLHAAHQDLDPLMTFDMNTPSGESPRIDPAGVSGPSCRHDVCLPHNFNADDPLRNLCWTLHF